MWKSMTDRPKKIEHYEKRFGVIAIEKGFITAQDLFQVLKIQVEEDMKSGTHRLTGEILLEQDKMAADQITEVLKNLFQK